MKRRLTSWLLTLAMLLSLVPAMGVTASAADDTSYTQAEIRGYESFESQLRSYESRDLKLMEDINYTVGIDDDSIYVMSNQKLDLNGHKITIDASKRAGFENLLCIRRGEFTLYDSKGGGELAVSFPNDDKAYSIIMMSSEKKDEPSKFTMNGGTLTKLHPNMTYTYGASGCIGDDYFNKPENGKRSQITINGGTINCSYAYKWDRSKPLLSLPVKAMPLALQLLYSNLTINGGTFNGIVWTDLLWRGTQDTEPRVVLNGGEFNAPFVVEDMSRTETQMVIDGAHFNDGFYVDDGDSKNTDVGTVPQLLLKSGVFNSPDKNPKLDIYNATAAHGDSSITKNRVILHAMKCFPNSAIKVNGKFYTSENINSLVKSDDKGYYLNFNSNDPIEVIRDAWGVMESVTLDGNKINYAKDWKGTVERMDNSKDHTIKFKWKDLAQELKDAGYSYRATCDRYISGNKTPTTDPISATDTEYSFTIPAGADPKVYSFDLQLNLKKGDNNIGIFSNEHIVKLVVNQAPVVKPDPTIAGNVYYTSGIVYGHSISTGTGNLPADLDSGKLRYQWQRSTNGGSTWTNIDGATRGSYTPGAADMDENVRIRVVVTAEGYLGEIVGAPVKVSKAANDDTPTWPDVVAQKDDSGAYKNFVINGFNSDQEYVYTTSAPTSGNEWPTGGTEIDSSTVTGLTEGKTYYIYTRFKETNTQTAGSKIRSSSVLLDDETKLNKIILTDASGKVYSSYGNGNTIYIKKGESVTLNVTKNPSGANAWSNFTFQSQYGVSGPFSVTYPTAPVAPGAEILSVTIHGDKAGTGTLAAEYNTSSPQNYGTWRVHVYENESGIGTSAEITVSPTFADATMHPGETMTLPEYTVTANPEGALADYHYEWYVRELSTSSGAMGGGYNVKENAYFKVNNDGTITAKAVHTGSENSQYKMVLLCAVKGEYDKTKLASFNVTVTEAPTITLTGLTVVPAKVNLAKVGDTCQLSAVKEPVNAEGSSLTWASDKTDIATVSVTGEVKAVAAGTATITVTCGSKSATCTVTVAHTHDTDGRDWMYMDPGTHIKTCTAGDDFKVEAHTFSAWTDNGNDTHSHHCTVCKMADGSTYTETASHNWQWAVDIPATSTTAGKQHEECPDCHAKRNEGTVIPATGGGSSSGGGGGGGSAATPPASDKVTKELKNAKEGSTVTIDMKGETKLPASVTKEIAGKDVTVELDMGGGIVWSFNGLDVPKGGVSLDLGVKTGTKTIPAKVIHALTGETTTVQLQLNHSGPFGMSLKLSVDLGKKHDGLYANLYFYNPKSSALEFQSASRISGGKASWAFDHASDYAIVIDKESHEQMTFLDVPDSAYYAEAVNWAVAKKITGGIGNKLFGPNDPCTRAQIVTFLWRAAGSPEPKAMSTFADVSADAYYAKAVAWAVENGITGGTGDGKFSPDATCTRAQAVTFLWRANGSPAVSGNAAFRDVAANAYYAAAVAWAEKNGITGGIGGGLFGSDHNCTRAQIVTFLYSSMK